METGFRKANTADLNQVWEILEGAIARRKAEGSKQWQDGYPNPSVIRNDIDKGVGFVLTTADQISGYCAILINDEPEYANIKGKWLSDQDFMVYHRVAISEKQLGKGLAQQMLRQIENYALGQGIYSLRADTNFDNAAMLKIFEKMGYQYCGEVFFRGSARKAFEKILKD